MTGAGREAALVGAGIVLAGLLPEAALTAAGEPNICAQTTTQLLQACQFEASDDHRVGLAVCLNISDFEASQTCRQETRESRADALAQCREIRAARTDVCEELGPTAYDPVVDPARFVRGIDNPYAPFLPGAFWVYEKHTPEGLEVIRIDVLHETRQIQGVTTTVVHDVVTLDGELIEDTYDWLAQDVDGNVWYFGEISQNFEDGLLDNLDGSWEAGKDGAKPGLWVKAQPQVGEFYRQEFAPNDAEDMVEALDIASTDPVPFAARGTGPVLKTRDFTPLNPDEDEVKYYLPGVGFVLELKPGSDERLELVDYGPR